MVQFFARLIVQTVFEGFEPRRDSKFSHARTHAHARVHLRQRESASRHQQRERNSRISHEPLLASRLSVKKTSKRRGGRKFEQRGSK